MAASLVSDSATSALLEIAREISTTLDLTECLNRVCAITGAALEADRASVILWSERKQSMVPAADIGTPPVVYERFRSARFTPRTIPEVDAIGAGRTVVITRQSRDPNAQRLLDALGIAVQVIAPLPAHGSTTGAVTVSYERERPMAESAVSLLAGIAQQAAVAIENARLFTNAQKAAEFRAALGDLSLALAREAEPERIVELVCAKGRAAFDADAAVVLLLDGGVLRVSALAGECGAVSRGLVVSIDAPGSLLADVFAGRSATLVNNFRDSAYGSGPLLRGLSAEAVLAAPLLSEGRVLGIVLFVDSKEPARFSRIHVEEATILATTVAVGLEHTRLLRALREESQKLAEHSLTLERSNRALADTTAELRALNREMEDLLYIASHDLRAPLINIQGFTHEARSQLHDLAGAFAPAVRETLADIEESLRFVHTSSAKMDTLISALLDVSRIASRDLVRQPVDVEALARHVAESFEFRLKERGISLTVGPLPRAVADPVRLEQVFSNLVDNAIKYLGDGQKEIALGAVDGPVVRYFVRDTGIGMTAAELNKVFRLFRRGRATHIPGEGIGLTLVRKIIERHGGRIWVESAEGKGTTVWFTLAPVAVPVD
ncbi:MAG: GAF domain-containing protein [Deltaproteobacteria bacterium]|nr:GAF domain-containing protein [Deltaproteobacteria bacterium]